VPFGALPNMIGNKFFRDFDIATMLFYVFNLNQIPTTNMLAQKQKIFPFVMAKKGSVD
jgi:hypothetical protein